MKVVSACLVILKRGRLYSSEAGMWGTGVEEALFGILEETYMYTDVNWEKGGFAGVEEAGTKTGCRNRLPLECGRSPGSTVFLLYGVGFVYMV